jgi:hypothetical protein
VQRSQARRRVDEDDLSLLGWILCGKFGPVLAGVHTETARGMGARPASRAGLRLSAREGDAPDRPPACEPHLGRLSVPVQPEPVCTTAGFAAPFSPFSSRRVANVDGPIACLLQDLWAERDKRATGTAGSKWSGPVEKRIRGLKIGPVGIRNTVGSLSLSRSPK